MPAADDALGPRVAALLAPHLAALPGPLPPPAALAEAQGAFCAALARANERLNLTSLTSPADMALAHVLDSLLALPLLPERGSLLDLGSGGGVPGVPLALARPGLEVRLCESRGRKAEALAAIVAELGLGPRVTVLHERAETWLVEHKVDVVVARAVGRLPKLLELLSPVRLGFARLVALKGPAADDELAELRGELPRLGFRLAERLDTELPEGRGARVILAFEPVAAPQAGPRARARAGARSGARRARRGGPRPKRA